MKSSILCGAALAALAFASSSAHAGLLYSFEPTDPVPLDGFTSNGIGVAQSTVGATNGVGSMEMVAPSGFNGAYTTAVLPADLANPSLSAITLDVDHLAQSAGTFSNIGFDFFVSNPSTSDFGEQWGPPTADWPTAYFAGQQIGLSIPVVPGGSPNPAMNALSFSQLIAAGYSVTEFQLLVSNNGTTIEYVDNVQAVVPEPASFTVVGAIGGLTLIRRRRK